MSVEWFEPSFCKFLAAWLFLVELSSPSQSQTTYFVSVEILAMILVNISKLMLERSFLLP